VIGDQFSGDFLLGYSFQGNFIAPGGSPPRQNTFTPGKTRAMRGKVYFRLEETKSPTLCSSRHSRTVAAASDGSVGDDSEIRVFPFRAVIVAMRASI
jgi:hypothetical protein